MLLNAMIQFEILSVKPNKLIISMHKLMRTSSIRMLTEEKGHRRN